MESDVKCELKCLGLGPLDYIFIKKNVWLTNNLFNNMN